MKPCSDSQVSSFFLVLDEKVLREIAYNTGSIEERSVPVITLDGFAGERSLGPDYLLKIDVQGFELEVLKGASELLKRTDHVSVESGIQRLYEGVPSFAELVTHMGDQGFHLMHMRAWHRGNQVLVETDMTFRRNSLEPAIRTDVDRFYIELK